MSTADPKPAPGPGEDTRPESRPETDTRRKLRALIDCGFTPRECAGSLGLSTQRIYQLLADMGIRPEGKK